jgi:hypothetical protein
VRAREGGERAALGRKGGWAGALSWAAKQKRAEKEEGVEGFKRKEFSFFKHIQTMNSNKSLNSNTQKNDAPACMQQ